MPIPEVNAPTDQQQQSPSADQAPMLPQSSVLPSAVNQALDANDQPNTSPHVSRWRAVLRGALAGLEGGGLPGAVMGATEGAVNPQQTYRNIGMQQAVRQSNFDISQARAANYVAEASRNAFAAAHQSDEWRQQQADRGLQQIQFFKSQGINPIRVIDDSDQSATNTLKDLTDANGGKVPPVYVAHLPGQPGQHGTLAIYSLDQVTQAPTAPGLVNEVQGYANRPPISSEMWAKMSPSDRQDAVAQAMDFWNPGVSPQTAPTLIDRYTSLKRAWAVSHMGEPNFNSVMNRFDDTISHLKEAQKGFDRHDLEQKSALARATAEQKAEVKEDHAPAPSDEWKPKATADERKKAGLAENIAENSNYIGNILLKNPNLVGAVSGRFTSIEQMMGTNDPAISGLGTAIHNIAMANSGVHGFRSQEGVKETENLLLNQFKNGPQAIAGALIALTNSTQTFIDIARPEDYKTHSNQGGARKGMRQ
jgi:hypothetical protein